MAESAEEASKRHLRELEGKNVQHYAVLLSTWLQTRMEHDRSLLTLSAAAIGLLVTILTTVGVPRLWMLWLYVGAFAGFITTIWTALRIYKLNSDKLEWDIRGRDAPGYKHIDLAPYDRRSVVSFVAGAVFSIIIGGMTATLTFVTADQEEPMPPENKMQQGAPERRSFQGIENLKPQLQQPEAPPAPAPTTEAEPVATPPTPAPSEGEDG